MGPKWFVAGPPVPAEGHLSSFVLGPGGEQLAGELWRRSVGLTRTDLAAPEQDEGKSDPRLGSEA